MEVIRSNQKSTEAFRRMTPPPRFSYRCSLLHERGKKLHEKLAVIKPIPLFLLNTIMQTILLRS
jgi:hypothetical protein